MIQNIVPKGYKMIGAYTPAKKVDMGGIYMVFVSGVQPPIDNNNVVVSDKIEEQTRLVFENINMILKEAGSSLDDVVEAVIYLKDIDDFAVVSRVRSEYFKNSMPASTLIEVSDFIRKGCKVEIKVTAVLKK